MSSINGDVEDASSSGVRRRLVLVDEQGQRGSTPLDTSCHVGKSAQRRTSTISLHAQVDESEKSRRGRSPDVDTSRRSTGRGLDGGWHGIEMLLAGSRYVVSTRTDDERAARRQESPHYARHELKIDDARQQHERLGVNERYVPK